MVPQFGNTKIYRGYYMPAQRYKFVSTSGHVILCILFRHRPSPLYSPFFPILSLLVSQNFVTLHPFTSPPLLLICDTSLIWGNDTVATFTILGTFPAPETSQTEEYLYWWSKNLLFTFLACREMEKKVWQLNTSVRRLRWRFLNTTKLFFNFNSKFDLCLNMFCAGMLVVQPKQFQW